MHSTDSKSKRERWSQGNSKTPRSSEYFITPKTHRTYLTELIKTLIITFNLNGHRDKEQRRVICFYSVGMYQMNLVAVVETTSKSNLPPYNPQPLHSDTIAWYESHSETIEILRIAEQKQRVRDP